MQSSYKGGTTRREERYELWRKEETEEKDVCLTGFERAGDRQDAQVDGSTVIIGKITEIEAHVE